MIPKVIHYCWFGGQPLPKLARKCIRSWQKYLPDYEIRRWDESNFDISMMPYVAEAYAAKKYAFVSDVARYWILYHNGGVYFDTDVEVIAPMDDIVARGAFMGCEQIYRAGNPPESLGVAPGLGMAAEEGHPFYREMLDYYASIHFDAGLHYTRQPTIVEITTRALVAHGLENSPGIQQVDGIWIYPHSYFNPMSIVTKEIVISPETRSIHHGAASWASPWYKFKTSVQKAIGPGPTRFLQSLKHTIKRSNPRK